jgi:uncharacterized protein
LEPLAVNRHLLAALFLITAAAATQAQIHLADEGDREAFRSWFTFLADAQFYRHTDDVADCAGLIRHAVREALRPHTPEWVRQAALPLAPAYPDVRRAPAPAPGGWPLFRVGPGQAAEFADARTIVSLNARPIGRDLGALHPGDLLYYRQTEQASPDHLMVYIGPSRFERDGRDWVVYHTGPSEGSPGEVRKTRLAELLHHPAARWRPIAPNPAFVGIFRLAWL